MFWDQVVRTKDGCWLWHGLMRENGYGRFKLADQGEHLAHRVAYAIKYGIVAEGQQILHRCDMPPCVRPDHLKAGTHQDNMRDAMERGLRGGSAVRRAIVLCVRRHMRTVRIMRVKQRRQRQEWLAQSIREVRKRRDKAMAKRRAERARGNPSVLVIERFGGISKMAALLGVDRTTPYRWQRNGFLPATLRGANLADTLLTLAQRHGVRLTRAEILLGGKV